MPPGRERVDTGSRPWFHRANPSGVALYTAHPDRYAEMPYRRTGRSGLKLPAISLGLWHNFGPADRTVETQRAILRRAFDLGVTHFDLANNYGPPAGSAEENFGRILAEDLKPYRDELVISSKAGYHMWNGPYGDWGSRKYLVSSLDQSLQRRGRQLVPIDVGDRDVRNAVLARELVDDDVEPELVVRQHEFRHGVGGLPREDVAQCVGLLHERLLQLPS